MADVSEHDSKEEGKADVGEDCWVNLTKGWYTICVDYQLRNGSEIVGLEVGRRNKT